MKRSHLMRTVAVVLAICAAAVQFYAVRELLAALLIFSALFGIVGFVVLVLIAIDGLALKLMTLLESGFTYVGARTAACIHKRRDIPVRSLW
jgi:uncharacterized membrane protein YdfJ with MMPL/SSD domain